MSRQNFLHDEPWDDIHEAEQIRSRVFGRPLGDMLGASLHELCPGRLVSLRNGTTEEQLSPGDVVYYAEGSGVSIHSKTTE